MATSSITAEFVISGEEQVNQFIDALEASAKERETRKRVPVNARLLTDREDIIKLMKKKRNK